MSRIFRTAVLGMVLTAPVAVVARAQDHPPMQAGPHQWSDGENPQWHAYLKERHRKDHDWAKANKKEQKDYWKWRDAHPDAH